IAQEMTLIRPQLVRRLILAGTAPRGGHNVHGLHGRVLAAATAEVGSAEGLIYLFFEPSETSVAKGQEFGQRIYTRQEGRDPDVTREAYLAQLDAATEWGIPDTTRLNRLTGIKQPTLVANGTNDIMLPTANTHLMAEHIPNAQIEIYPDAGHGFLFQYPEE